MFFSRFLRVFCVFFAHLFICLFYRVFCVFLESFFVLCLRSFCGVLCLALFYRDILHFFDNSPDIFFLRFFSYLFFSRSFVFFIWSILRILRFFRPLLVFFLTFSGLFSAFLAFVRSFCRFVFGYWSFFGPRFRGYYQFCFSSSYNYAFAHF